MNWPYLLLASVLSLMGLSQDKTVDTHKKNPAPRVIQWKEGVSIDVRIPVASATKRLMTTISFPEKSIETSISGWQKGDPDGRYPGEISTVERGGLLFVQLLRTGEGELNVIGGSGTHYLLHVKGIENAKRGDYDPYLKITRVEEKSGARRMPKRKKKRPGRAQHLMEAMRLGLHVPGYRILRASRELAFLSKDGALEGRLLFIYQGTDYEGYIYEITNRTNEVRAVLASKFAPKNARPVMTTQKDYRLGPKGTTRLYHIVWKE